VKLYSIMLLLLNGKNVISTLADIVEAERASIEIAVVCIVALFPLVALAVGKAWLDETRWRKKYGSIFRVVSVPSDQDFVLKAAGTSIELGDYGWEAEPIRQDGLIYLHGLNPRWQVVWYAGFRPDQVVVFGPKPRSQYFMLPFWVRPEKIPQCPFPVKRCEMGAYPIYHFGLPVKIERNRVQGRETIPASNPSPSPNPKDPRSVNVNVKS